MLMLSRAVGETILIGEDIRIVVHGVRSGGIVTLGIAAPRSLLVLREELTDIVSDALKARRIAECEERLDQREREI